MYSEYIVILVHILFRDRGSLLGHIFGDCDGNGATVAVRL